MSARRSTKSCTDESNGSPVRILARLVDRHHEQWELCARLDESLNSLRRGGLYVVIGESQLLGQLRTIWQDAAVAIRELKQGSDLQSLDRLMMLVEDVVWEVASDLAADLENKLSRQREQVREYTDQVAEWRGRIEEMAKQLNGARKLHAAVLKEDAQFNHLDAKVREADRELKDLNYAKVQRCLQELGQRVVEAKQLLEALQKKGSDGKLFSPQADLLVLRSPDDPAIRRVHYTVLLRTPSEPGTHGINIEASSTLSEQDRATISDEIGQITSAINLGLARSAGSPSAVTEADLRNLTTGGASQPSFGRPARPNDLIRDVGDLMYRLVIPDQMQMLLSNSPCSLTVTTNDLELPWELMHVEDDFLCLKLPVARMPMGRTVPRRPKQPQPRSKLRFLLIYADPKDNLPLARNEVETIEQSLRREWKDRIDIQLLKGADSSGRQLNEALRRGQFDVIHYAGHAGFDKKDGDLSGLLLHNEEIFFAQKVRRILEGRPLVFLNACEAGFVANPAYVSKIENYLQKPAEGLASAFIYGGAVGCIGALWPIYDGPAAQFAVTFYGYVLEGYTIGEAMRRARLDIRKNHPEQITWASFVLYGDPRFNLVD